MFVAWPKQRFLRHLEGQAHALRQRAKLGSLDRLEPAALIATFPGILLADLTSLAGDTHSAELSILNGESASWSAMALRIDGGPWLITWNPWHAETRARVSIMEEVAHIVLEHKPTKLVPHPATGLPVRTWSPSKEKEAYGVASAALLPFAGIVQLLRRGNVEAEIAEHFGVSIQLVTMRINTTSARSAAGVEQPQVAGLRATIGDVRSRSARG